MRNTKSFCNRRIQYRMDGLSLTILNPVTLENLLKGNKVILKLRRKWKPTSKKKRKLKGMNLGKEEHTSYENVRQNQDIKIFLETACQKDRLYEKHFEYLRKWKAEVESLTQYTTKIQKLLRAETAFDKNELFSSVLKESMKQKSAFTCREVNKLNFTNEWP